MRVLLLHGAELVRAAGAPEAVDGEGGLRHLYDATGGGYSTHPCRDPSHDGAGQRRRRHGHGSDSGDGH